MRSPVGCGFGSRRRVRGTAPLTAWQQCALRHRACWWSNKAGRAECRHSVRPGRDDRGCRAGRADQGWDHLTPSPLRGANIGYADIIYGAERGSSEGVERGSQEAGRGVRGRFRRRAAAAGPAAAEESPASAERPERREVRRAQRVDGDADGPPPKFDWRFAESLALSAVSLMGGPSESGWRWGRQRRCRPIL